ncbi:hypothetical protein VP01_578g2 [Puccinia sorghi]|uniref:Uncharacterized protein n=1 Tax=Puccinia sorghi TaxID=27349 RepID=A0A0L6UI94_9BASI|nr:hypothetical protein VP01_578g2 [Puccinia sorghi]
MFQHLAASSPNGSAMITPACMHAISYAHGLFLLHYYRASSFADINLSFVSSKSQILSPETMFKILFQALCILIMLGNLLKFTMWEGAWIESVDFFLHHSCFLSSFNSLDIWLSFGQNSLLKPLLTCNTSYHTLFSCFQSNTFKIIKFYSAYKFMQKTVLHADNSGVGIKMIITQIWLMCLISLLNVSSTLLSVQSSKSNQSSIENHVAGGSRGWWLTGWWLTWLVAHGLVAHVAGTLSGGSADFGLFPLVSSSPINSLRRLADTFLRLRPLKIFSQLLRQGKSRFHLSCSFLPLILLIPQNCPRLFTFFKYHHSPPISLPLQNISSNHFIRMPLASDSSLFILFCQLLSPTLVVHWSLYVLTNTTSLRFFLFFFSFFGNSPISGWITA